MKRILFSFLITPFFFLSSYSQAITGLWETYHPKKQTPLSHIEIYEVGNKTEARVLKLLDMDIHPVCTACSGEQKDQDIEGMVVIWDMVEHVPGNFKKGRILDPCSGKTYKCSIRWHGPDKIEVRAFHGIKALGRSQYWQRISRNQEVFASE